MQVEHPGVSIVDGWDSDYWWWVLRLYDLGMDQKNSVWVVGWCCDELYVGEGWIVCGRNEPLLDMF